MSHRWIPSATNVVADAIARPSRESIIRLMPHIFQRVWDDVGPFDVNLMASDASVQRVPGYGRPLPIFSRYYCDKSSGIDGFFQDVSVLPGTNELSFGYCFPPPVMTGAFVQHLAECHADAFLVVPDVQAFKFPQLQRATVWSCLVGPANTRGFFHWSSSDGS